MKYHDIDIEIGKDGKVRATVQGAKGKGCLAYVKLLEEIVGRVSSQELTAEYYEPDENVRINPTIEINHRR